MNNDKAATGLPNLPETQDKEFFNELNEIYSAIQILADNLNLLAFGDPSTDSQENINQVTIQHLLTVPFIVREAITPLKVAEFTRSSGLPRAQLTSNANFYVALDTAAVGEYSRFVLAGCVSGYTGLTVGARYESNNGVLEVGSTYAHCIAITPTTILLTPDRLGKHVF